MASSVLLLLISGKANVLKARLFRKPLSRSKVI